VDEQKRGRGVKNVDHVRRVPFIFGPSGGFTSSDGITPDPCNPAIGAYAAARDFRVNDYILPYWAVEAMAYGGSPPPGWDFSTSWTDANFQFAMPPDRLGEIPARVLSAIDGVHLSTSLIESRDMPATYGMFVGRNKLVSQLKNLAFTPKNILRRTLSGRQAFKLLSDAQLGYSFGIAPTIRDARAITKEILRHGGKAKSVSGTTTLVGKAKGSVWVGSHWGSPRSGVIGDKRLSSRGDAQRVDGCRWTIDRPQYNTDFFQHADDFMRRFGGQNPLGLIWEVLPLSFTVDWLLSVDDVLDNLWLSKSSTIQTEFWSSLKTSKTWMVEYKTGVAVERTGSVIWSSFVPLTSSYSHYNRTRRGSPSLVSSARLRGASLWNLYHIALIALGLHR
jgi:hypothetical protein